MTASSSSGVKILVADDSASDRAAARAILGDCGYVVVEATDGQQVFEAFNRERPQLVILDVVMPKIGGLEVCRILKAKASGFLPVLMVSTRNSVNARIEGLRSGADDYLGKPYDAAELRARVDALLRTRAQFAHGDGAEGEAPRAARAELGAGEFRRRLVEEFERAERYSDPLACLRVEVDESSEAGRAPSELAAALYTIIEGNIRKIDLVYRADDRGYLVVLPNTHFPGALTVAERIAREVRKPLRGESSGFTVSVGVSFFPNKDTRTLQDLLSLVDAALERARREGGGKICLFQHQGYLYSPDD